MKIILGVTGSIAAYKAADLTNLLTKKGHQVQVVMTQSAQSFITELTLQTLSKRRVLSEAMEEEDPKRIEHIDCVKDADVFVVAPATANIISKLALGIGDDLLSTMGIVAHNLPMIVAPAMNTRMYENPVIQQHLEQLKKRGVQVVEPRETLLACGDIGKGALADLNDIIATIEAAA